MRDSGGDRWSNFYMYKFHTIGLKYRIALEILLSISILFMLFGLLLFLFFFIDSGNSIFILLMIATTICIIIVVIGVMDIAMRRIIIDNDGILYRGIKLMNKMKWCEIKEIYLSSKIYYNKMCICIKGSNDFIINDNKSIWKYRIRRSIIILPYNKHILDTICLFWTHPIESK